jgi:hypothetical protein
MRSKTRQEREKKRTGENIQMKQYQNKKGGINIERKKDRRRK